MRINLNSEVKQADLAVLVGISQPAVSQLMTEGKIPSSGALGAVVRAYCHRLREQAAARMGGGALDLVQERAALAREQRIGQAMKNAIARGEFAQTAVLKTILDLAASTVADQIEQAALQIDAACPDLPADARAVIDRVLAGAALEWLRSTSELVTRADADLSDEPDFEEAEDGQ